MTVTKIFSVALAIAFCASAASAAPTNSPIGRITFMTVGLNDPLSRVQLDIAFYNPDGCSMTDGYIVDSVIAGSQLFTSFLMTAFTANRRIYLTVDGCVLNRPRVIGVTMFPN